MDLAQAAFPSQMRSTDRFPVIRLDVAQGRRDLCQQGGIRADFPVRLTVLPLLNPQQFQNKGANQKIDIFLVIRALIAELFRKGTKRL